MYIRPLPGVTLETWTLSQEKPQPAHMPPDIQETTYYIYYSHGEKPTTPWSFSLYFKVSDFFHNMAIVVCGLISICNKITTMRASGLLNFTVGALYI